LAQGYQLGDAEGSPFASEKMDDQRAVLQQVFGADQTVFTVWQQKGRRCVADLENMIQHFGIPQLIETLFHGSCDLRGYHSGRFGFDGIQLFLKCHGESLLWLMVEVLNRTYPGPV
jgi:hypothetical protein